MLYKKKSEKLDMELFRSPTSEYRGTPFWAWNCELDEKELLWQIEVLKEMGFGGFHMHPRSGMSTNYLSDEFMALIRSCTDKAKKEKMLAWLYDEDRFPSGSAGGFVTRDPRYRGKYLCFTKNRIENCVSAEEGYKTGEPYFVAAYDCSFDNEGNLASYKRIGENDEAQGEKFYAYLKTRDREAWFNGEAYVDTLSQEAMKRFIDITYEAYLKTVGDEFDKTVPAIFTDEPQFLRKSVRAFSTDRGDINLPYTTDFAQTYKDQYGEDILDTLPEIYWERADGVFSQTRYRYHDHVTERFARAFCDQCGDWCEKHGLALTGHMMEEVSLGSQTGMVGETMRCYRGFHIPGVDMLALGMEFTTCKQAQSATHQFGREAMMSELYGVTTWRFDFRGHKFHGDWQAALGVTVRVPHLSWVSMKGSAKRDYPATINYQSPWYKEYSLIEDHFSRVNTVMSRGVPNVRVGVIHPIESYWLAYGPADKTSDLRSNMEHNFFSLTNNLLFNSVDFDFISESLIPDLCAEQDEKGFKVGAMTYDTIILPELLTIRSTTLAKLLDFKARGGKLICIGSAPSYVDGAKSDAAKQLFEGSLYSPDTSAQLVKLLEDERDIKIFTPDGRQAGCFLHQMRCDGDTRYLFIASGRNQDIDVTPVKDYTIVLKGEYKPTLLDTMSGEERAVSYKTKNGTTTIYVSIGTHDSLLFSLEKGNECDCIIEKNADVPAYVIDFKSSVDYERTEPNVALLDLAQWSVDGGPVNDTEEVLRIDRKLREIYNYPLADGCKEQPWVIPDTKPEHFPTLRFSFTSEMPFKTQLACEEATEIKLNGESVSVKDNGGYYVDKSIKTYDLPDLKVGENVLEVTGPITARVGLENMFLLGDFDVYLEGTQKVLKRPSGKISFGSIDRQGLAFYGGNIVYKCDIELKQDSDIELCVPQYRGAMMRIFVDGEDMGELIYCPYKKRINGLGKGKHLIEIKLYGHRDNAFGTIHNCNRNIRYEDPGCWYSTGILYSYDYRLAPIGVMISPMVSVYPKQ